MDITIIIVSYNTKKLLNNCINSIIKNTKNISFEIIVVDNASKDGSQKMIEEYLKKNKLKLIKNKKNLGFGKANNQGIKEANGRYILLLNSDTVIQGNVIGEMAGWMDKKKRIGIASCALKNKDGSYQGTGGSFPDLLRVFSWMFFLEDLPLVDIIIKPFHPMHPHSPFYKGDVHFKSEHETDWVTGAFFLMRKTVVKDIGYLDNDYFMYVEELDYCYRAKKKGWKVFYNPKWSITHLGGASSTDKFPIISEYRGIKTFYKKHMPKWQFPFLRTFLKGGALLRIPILGLLKGKGVANTYVKAFQVA